MRLQGVAVELRLKAERGGISPQRSIMNIKQYSINEATARAAKSANSFSDYVPNSATNGYLDLLGKFTRAVERLIDKYGKTATPEQMELVDYYADKYSARLAAAINRENHIRAMCPSIMIAGGGNFPVRKKQKQNAAMDKFWAENGELFEPTNNFYFKKIETLLSNKTIYSNDALALEKLENKLKDLEEKHAEAKARNAYYRKNGTMKGYEGMSDEEAASFDKGIERAYSWEKQPYPSYVLQSNNAEMKRIRERIAEITRLKENAKKTVEDKYPQVEGVEVIENAEAMRIQLIFDGKPDEATRNLLKSNGFRWSPSFGAWQRQLTGNGIYATKSVLEKLKDKE